MKIQFIIDLVDYARKAGTGNEKADMLVLGIISLLLILLLAWIANLIAKVWILRIVHHVVKKSKTQWDDALMQRRVFTRLSHIAPALLIFLLSPSLFHYSDSTVSILQLVAIIYMIITGIFVIDSFLNAVVDIYRTYEFARRIPVKGFVQIIKIALFFTAGIIVLSLVVGKDPSRLLAGMGAMTAVLMLIFKDSILGFVAGIQLSTNQMVHIGDWIEMPKYGADGDVIDISLTTVKVQNWDKTISTIPAYTLISDSFKNWRGMSESGGRRIKRSIYIDMNSIKFCDQAMIDRFKKIQYISDYIDSKTKEVSDWNLQQKIDDTQPVNGRRLTNIGTFRAYLISYLKNHPKIHKDMTFLVRQLAPASTGLPIEIYVFSNDQVWANYEAIQSDIFDHILAVVPEFGLKVYQQPTGSDFMAMAKS